MRRSPLAERWCGMERHLAFTSVPLTVTNAYSGCRSGVRMPRFRPAELSMGVTFELPSSDLAFCQLCSGLWSGPPDPRSSVVGQPAP